jgi:ribonuclease III
MVCWAAAAQKIGIFSRHVVFTLSSPFLSVLLPSIRNSGSRLMAGPKGDHPDIETTIGHKFRNHALLIEALRHPSLKGGYPPTQGKRWFTPSNPKPPLDQGRLEFLGDSVLGLIVAEHLFEQHAEMSEGHMTMIRQSVVNEKVLADAARELQLGKWIQMSQSEEDGGGRSKDAVLADTFEAVLGAIYLDRGLEPARGYVMKARPPPLHRSQPYPALSRER